jgi:hypothetical protein
MKKTKKIIKFLLTGGIWTYVCLYVAQKMMWIFWKFNPFNANQWKVIQSYWNEDGIINSFRDYMFFFAFPILLILWLWGLKKFYRLDYVRLALAPFKYLNERQLKKYENINTHIAIKNISVGEKLTVEDIINQRIKKEGTPTSSKVSSDLRQEIAKKITERKEQ